ncbi:MAG: GbsR/MarR family transcriptional regulator [Propionibacteriaceae bacterium]
MQTPDEGAATAAMERMALTLAARGMQRMSARTLALFVFTEQPSLTMSDIRDLLVASAGSVSMAVRSLVGAGLVERVPAAGRRDHYRLRTDAWERLFSSENTILADLIELSAAGLSRSAPGGAAADRLGRMHDFYAYLAEELPRLVDRFRAESQNRDAHPDHHPRP